VLVDGLLFAAIILLIIAPGDRRRPHADDGLVLDADRGPRALVEG
jgi:hypothetical protein